MSKLVGPGLLDPGPTFVNGLLLLSLLPFFLPSWFLNIEQLRFRDISYVLPIPGPGPISDRRPDRTGPDRTWASGTGRISKDRSIVSWYYHIIISSYDSYDHIISSYHHNILPLYHHIIISSSHHIIIASYDKTKNTHATFWWIQPIVPGFDRIVIRFA